MFERFKRYLKLKRELKNKKNIRKAQKESNRDHTDGAYKEDFGLEKNVLKIICMIIKEPVWYYFLLLGSMLCFIDTIAHAIIAIKYINTKIEPKSVFFILGELFWIFDGVLNVLQEYLEYRRPSFITLALFVNTILSTLPIEFCFTYAKGYYVAELNRMLRIINVVYIFHTVNAGLRWRVILKFIQILYLFVFFTLVLAFMLVISTTKEADTLYDNENSNHYLISILYSASKYLTKRGVNKRFLIRGIYVNTFFITMALIIFIFVFCLYTALITFIFCNYEQQITQYRYIYECVKTYLAWKTKDKAFIAQINSYFKDMWNVCQGYQGYMGETRMEYCLKEIKHLLPDVYINQIQINIFLAALTHSMLFENMEVMFLCQIASLMKQQNYVSKQYIYHQNDLKDKMVYITYGIVQVISEEDDETAIFTLTNGSILGETSLIIPYKSSTNVQCVTECTIQILERNDLMKLVCKYPSFYKQIQKKVLKRYSINQSIHKIKQVICRRKKTLSPRCLSALWINYTLHKALGDKGPENARKHIIDNIYLRDFINEDTFKKYLFTANYLRLYSLAGQDRIEGDSLFAKHSFPIALFPNTGLTLFWDIFISIMAIIANIQLPYIILNNSTDMVLYCTVYLYTSLWFFDILVQLRTAVTFKNYISINILEILTVRTQDYIFMIDVLSCFPLEFCFGLFILKRSKLVYLNRMLKIVRLYKLLMKWEYRYDNFHPLIVRLTCMTFLLLYTAYLTTSIYGYLICSNNCTIKNIYYLSLFSIQIITSASFDLPLDSLIEAFPLLNISIDILFCVALIILYSYIFNVFASKNVNVDRICDKSYYLRCMIRNKTIIQSLDSIIQTELEASNGLNLYDPSHFYKCIPKPLVSYYFKTTCLDWLIELPIFYGIPKNLVLDILKSSGYFKIFPPACNIYFVGDLMEDLYILSQGSCVKVCGVTHKNLFLNRKIALNDLETFFNIPCRYTLHTLTHCEVILINNNDLKRILLKYPDLYSFESSMNAMGNLRRNLLKTETTQIQFTLKKKREITIMGNNPNNPTRSKTFQTLLMSTTFIPHEKMFKSWEIFRCVCAVFSTMLYTTSFLTFLPMSHGCRIIMVFLDISAFIDMYIRLHVCYYNDKNILITHPYLTSNHYIKSSFLIDFIAFLPIHYFLKYPRYLFLNLNHVLQIHRYIGFIRYNKINNTKRLSKLYVITYLPLLLIFLNICSYLYIISTCIFMKKSNNLGYDMMCNTETLFNLNNMETLHTVLEFHMYALYAASNSFTAISFQGFEIIDIYTVILIGFSTTIGFYFSCLLAANIFKYYMSDYHSVIMYDEGKHVLFSCMKEWKVNIQLHKLIVRFLSKNIAYRKVYIDESLKLFGKNFTRDYKFQRFGATLIKCCLVESKDFAPFIRNILLHARYPIILKDCVVYKLNDIIDETIFVYSGSILLTTPNNQICISLKQGSIVGNLCCMYYNRMFTNAFALSNVELISIKTSKFFEILQHFPYTEQEFSKLKCIHIDHIPGYTIETKDNSLVDTQITFWNSNKGSILSSSLLILGCFFSQILYLYQISVSEFTIVSFIFTVITDLCYIGSLIIERMVNQNSSKSIFEKDLSLSNSPLFNNIVWIVSIFAAIPFDYIVYPLKLDSTKFYYYFLFLKCNVLFRNIHLYIYFGRVDKGGRLVMSKFYMLIFSNIIFIYMCTAILLVPSDLSPINMNRHIDRNKMIDMDVYSRYDLFLSWLEPIASSINHLKQGFEPISVAYAIILIIIVLSVMYFTTFLYAITIALVFAKNMAHWNYNNDVNKLYHYIRKPEISSAIFNHIADYNNLIWKSDSTLKYNYILKVFSDDIKEGIMSYRVGHIVEKHILFKHCHPDFSRQLYLKMKLELYQCGDYIQYTGVVNECMYWIIYGSVVILKESGHNEIIIGDHKTGGYFGFAEGVLPGLPNLLSYRCTSETYVIVLKRDKWEYLLPFFPATRETIYKHAWSEYNKEKSLLGK